MAKFADLCRFLPAGTGGALGTGPFVYASKVQGFLNPTDAHLVDQGVYKYRAENSDFSQWEIGEGVYTAATGTLTRVTVIANSAGTFVALNFTVIPQVAIVALAEDVPSLTENNVFTGSNSWTQPIIVTDVATPATPAAGKSSIYVDLTTKVLKAINDAGAISTAVFAASAPAHQWIYGITAAGVLLAAQPSFADISGSVTAAQIAPAGVSGNLQYNAAGALGAVLGSSVSAIGSLTLGGQTATVSDPVLNLSQTWNAPGIVTTGASGTGTIATITFAAQPAAFPVGSIIVVNNVQPFGYGTGPVGAVVTASTTTSVSYANATTGPQTVAGTVQQQMSGINLNITNTATTNIYSWLNIKQNGSSVFAIGSTFAGTAALWLKSGTLNNTNYLMSYDGSGTLYINSGVSTSFTQSNLTTIAFRTLPNSNQTTEMRDTGSISWSAAGDPNSAFDVAIWRSAAGTLSIGGSSTTVGDATGSLQAALVTIGGTISVSNIDFTTPKYVALSANPGGDNAFVGAGYSADGNALKLIGAKSRGVTIGAHGLVQSGDQLFYFAGYGSDGVNWIWSGAQRLIVDGPTSAPGIVPTRWSFETRGPTNVNPFARMTVDSMGTVNIGLGNTVTINSPLLNLVQTWNAPAIATTGASGTGTVATITFAAQALPYPVGSTIVVAGITPIGYNGTYAVTASTTTSVSYSNTTTGAQTIAGTVQQKFDAAIKVNVTNTASAGGSFLMDLQTGGATAFSVDRSGIVTLGRGGGSFTFATDFSSNLYLTSATTGGVGIQGNASGAQPRIGVLLVTDAYQRITFGMDATDNPYFGFGPGTGPRDVFMTRGGAGTIAIGTTSTSGDTTGTLAVGTLTLGGSTATVYSPALNGSQTWNAAAIATTGASGTGTVATITFAAQALAYPVGSVVVVSGVAPAGYNGTFVVTASSTTSVSYSNATTGAQTVAGTVQQEMTGLTFSITPTAAARNSSIVDFRRGSISPMRVYGTVATTLFIQGANDSAQFANLVLGDDLLRDDFTTGSAWTFSHRATHNFLFWTYQGGAYTNILNMTTTAITALGGVGLGFSSFEGATPDALMYRQGAGIIAQSNLTNAQALRIYLTTDSNTNPVNFSNGILDWQAHPGNFTVGTSMGGTGLAYDLNFQSATGNIKFLNGFGHWSHHGTGGFELGWGGVQGTTPNILFTSNGTTQVNGGTVTASAPALNVIQTWNNAAVSFTGALFNMTLTASAARPLIADFQLNNASVFQVFDVGISTAGRSIFAATIQPAINSFDGGGTSPYAQVLGTDFQTGFAGARFVAGTGGSKWHLAKSRGATVGAQVALLANDDIGLILFEGSDGTVFQESAQIVGTADGPYSTNISPGRITLWTSPYGAFPAPVERMRVDSGGNVYFPNGRIGGTFTPLSNAGQTATITIATPAVISITAHGFVPGQQLSFTTTGALPTGITAGAVYYVIPAGLTANAFEISAAPGGAAVNTSGTQSGVHTCTASNASAYASGIGIWGPSGLTGALTTPALEIDQTWNTTGAATAFKLNVTNIASAAGSRLVDWQVGGSSVFQVDAAGNLYLNPAGLSFGSKIQFQNQTATNALTISTDGGVSFNASITASDATLGSGIKVATGGFLGWSSIAGASNTGDTALFRQGAGIIAQVNGANAQKHAFYNLTDSNTAPVNYERFVIDWQTTVNTIRLAVENGGTGLARNLILAAGSAANITIFNPHSSGGGLYFDVGGGGGAGVNFQNNGATYVNFRTAGWNSFNLSNAYVLSWSSTTTAGSATEDLSLYRVATGVLGLSNNASSLTATGWLNYGGQASVATDFSVTNSAVLVPVTGLSVTLQVNRKYEFEVCLLCTDAAAGGVQAALTVPTGATIVYSGFCMDANTIKGQTRATASGTAVASTTTTGTTPDIYIKGYVVMGATAGSLVVQFAQNTSNATASTVKAGSTLKVNDTP